MKTFVFVLALALISPSITSAAAKAALKNYIRSLESHDPAFKAIELEFNSKTKEIEANAPYWTLNIAGQHQQNDSGTPDSSLIISSEIPQTGTSLTINQSRSETLGSESTLSSFEIGQEIWGFGSFYLYDSVTEKNKLYLKSIKIETEESLESYWYSRLKLLIQWSFAHERLKIQENILKANKRLYGYVEKKYRSKIAREDELLEATASTEQKKNQLDLVRNLATQFSRQVKSYTSREMLPPKITKILKLNLSRPANFRAIKLKNLDIDIAQLELLDAQEVQKAQADVFLGTSQLESQGTKTQEYYAGLNLTIPIKQTSLDLQENAKRANLEFLKKSLKSLEKDLTTTLSTKELEQVHLSNELATRRNLSKILDKVYKLKWDRYQKGRISFRELADAGERLDTAKIEELNKQEASILAKLGLLRHKNQLLNEISTFLGK